ncbi:MAG: bifunctional glutamate N-acetyltransferase/amino-acid acetyltransferase ArgJ [Treponema sp.]|jgi:glutamate N-acetyltransferase/amino-acid N-acetyltransferase|nr:bifunctional glutamate N-acetyltransferase/amino-acid acetyltransferase ArgJ [Treponema sp.]
MKKIAGGVCAPKNFMAAGIRCGIKASSQKKDLALIFSQKECTAAAMFTTNRVKAACVTISQKHIENGKLHAIIANSGNANACTGDAGIDAAVRMAQAAGKALGVEAHGIAVASTGVIGVPLQAALIESNIDVLKNKLRSDEAGHAAALEAIMTTDTRKKEIALEFDIDGKKIRIGAMAKGSGMIHPNMATMLAFITSDAVIEKDALDAALNSAVKRSFNRLTVDGDTSTNDMVVIMANGEGGNAPIITGSPSYAIFVSALTEVCVTLTRAMARDGEGATKLITITVTNAPNEENAGKLAKSVASSSLVKAACFGADANWGRVLCALGYSGADFDPAKTSVSYKSVSGQVDVCKNGEPAAFSEEKAKLILSQEEVEIYIDINNGGAQASVWGCDLTYDYVKINGDYRS